MRPAFSIIFFTVMSGFGFGLAALVSLNLIAMPELSDKLLVAAVIMIFSGAGLLSSTFHLGHPERAWRALTQWRSSWLSREGVLAIITLDAVLGWFLYAHFVGEPPLWAGIIVAGLCLATIFCTAMIYASLRTVARWHHPLTSVAYLAFGIASGLVGLAALTALTSGPSASLAMAASWALVGAWVLSSFGGRSLAVKMLQAQEKQPQVLASLEKWRLSCRPTHSKIIFSTRWAFRLGVNMHAPFG